MKKKNLFLGFAPLFFLATYFGKGFVSDTVRILFATLAFVSFSIYVLITIIQKGNSSSNKQ